MPITATRRLQFAMGHRVHGHEGKCRHLHGHNARAMIRLDSESLDRLGLVMDFKEIGDYVKSWLDAEIDHNMLLYKEDPILPLLRGAGERVYVMDTNPSAENIARLVFEYVERGGFPVVEVAIVETASAVASYRRT